MIPTFQAQNPTVQRKKNKTSCLWSIIDLLEKNKMHTVLCYENYLQKIMQLTSENFKLFISVKKDTFPTKISCLNKAYKAKHYKGGRPKTLSL